MKVLVIDGQGGGLGKQIVSELKKAFPSLSIMAVGTNTAATNAMLKAGADMSATGENSVVVCARRADVIIGPIGIVIADSMLGEVTEKMALAVARSDAYRILVPVVNSHCDNYVVGVENKSMGEMISSIVTKMESLSPVDYN